MRFRFAADFAALAIRCAVPVLFSTFIACGFAVAQQPAKPKAPAAAAPAKPNLAESNKCVGVISAIGDTFSMQKIGTEIGDELNTAPIDTWQIDNLVINKISVYLSDARTVKRVSYPKGAFSSVDARQHPFFFNYGEELKGIVRQLTLSTKCDRYVVVVKGSSAFGLSHQRVHGLGIVEAGISIFNKDFIHAFYWIKLYDGKTYDLIRERGATTDPSFLGQFAAAHTHPMGGPQLEVDRSWWPSTEVAKSTRLKDGIRSLVEQSLDVTMPLVLRVE
jgi:hypothetical protein